MKKVYACLVGEWVCLNDDQECRMGSRLTSPDIWFEENAEVWNPETPGGENSYYEMPYVNIHFKGRDYRINPIFIQVVTK